VVSNRTNSIFIAVAVVIFAIAGLWLGRPPSATPSTFGQIVIAFVADDRTRVLLFTILADVVTGVIAAMRMGVADAQQTARFFETSILRYVLGYLLFWCVALFGLGDILPETITNAIAAVGYAPAMVALTASIIDNVRRASLGNTPPEDENMADPPADPGAIG